MQSRAMEILVGAFICLGVAAIFVLTMRVSNFHAGTGAGYTLTASFNDIGGLKGGAPVKMGGVEIGRVTKIKLDQQTFQAVAKIHIQSSYKIPKGSTASVLTSGLLGSKYLGVSPGGSPQDMEDGDSFAITQSALVFEHLIGQFMTQMSGNGDSSSGGGPN
ncbi:outer membrane lipid asymmetry maintenance protein MlaD [Salinisphaera sp. USBA-960]|uniref:outer membrane lipid asymmetry maintenance protein MlaD n=1 Tax=Salinisphaera orenii TaxID=856731 RepID=UPI000DBE7D66|nr:outer membrane lipid asymmetry maintenance protein MlaD [Salifodinibacter halophilus]NNC26926.1 outer membrane lipid asymmetry maintenance protein MlaD [Salifodinibacter halophilus]